MSKWYLSSVWLEGWRTVLGVAERPKLNGAGILGLSAVGLVTCTPFSTRGSAHLPLTLLRRSHHPIPVICCADAIRV
jgi:hypothetical protein